MYQPKTLAESPWGQSWIEVLVLFVLTTVASGMLFKLHWMAAMLTAPVIMLGLLLAVMVGVQLLWMTVLGMEKVGTAIGLRKSPLS